MFPAERPATVRNVATFLEIHRIEGHILRAGPTENTGIPCVRRAADLPVARAVQAGVGIADYSSLVESLNLALGPEPAALENEYRGVETDELAGEGEARRSCSNDADVGFESCCISREAHILLQGIALRGLR
jgi:hypothetical protein